MTGNLAGALAEAVDFQLPEEEWTVTISKINGTLFVSLTIFRRRDDRKFGVRIPVRRWLSDREAESQAGRAVRQMVLKLAEEAG